MTINQALWTKHPTYEEILRDMEKDYKVSLPDRVALQFYDSFAMTKFREMQEATTEGEAQKDEHRREAVVQAASDQGVGTHKARTIRRPVAPAELARKRGASGASGRKCLAP